MMYKLPNMGHVDIPNTPGNVEERTRFSNMRWKKEEEEEEEEEGEKKGKKEEKEEKKEEEEVEERTMIGKQTLLIKSLLHHTNIVCNMTSNRGMKRIIYVCIIQCFWQLITLLPFDIVPTVEHNTGVANFTTKTLPVCVRNHPHNYHTW